MQDAGLIGVVVCLLAALWIQFFAGIDSLYVWLLNVLQYH